MTDLLEVDAVPASPMAGLVVLCGALGCSASVLDATLGVRVRVSGGPDDQYRVSVESLPSGADAVMGGLVMCLWWQTRWRAGLIVPDEDFFAADLAASRVYPWLPDHWWRDRWLAHESQPVRADRDVAGGAVLIRDDLGRFETASYQGASNGRFKAGPSTVSQIIRLRGAGLSTRGIAAQVGLSNTQVHRIIIREAASG